MLTRHTYRTSPLHPTLPHPPPLFPGRRSFQAAAQWAQFADERLEDARRRDEEADRRRVEELTRLEAVARASEEAKVRTYPDTRSMGGPTAPNAALSLWELVWDLSRLTSGEALCAVAITFRN